MDDDGTRALANREPLGAADAYERRYMAGEGTVLHRDRMIAGKKFNGLLLAVAAFMVGLPLAMGTASMGALAALPVLAVVWLFFGVLRTTVSERSVNIQYGLVGPRIPIAAIESVRVMDYDWKAFGGWGIRRGREGWMYNMMGDGGRAVRIAWRTPAGKSRVTFVGTRTADQLGAAIEQARAALPAAATPPALDAGED